MEWARVEGEAVGHGARKAAHDVLRGRHGVCGDRKDAMFQGPGLEVPQVSSIILWRLVAGLLFER